MKGKWYISLFSEAKIFRSCRSWFSMFSCCRAPKLSSLLLPLLFLTEPSSVTLSKRSMYHISALIQPYLHSPSTGYEVTPDLEISLPFCPCPLAYSPGTPAPGPFLNVPVMSSPPVSALAVLSAHQQSKFPHFLNPL